MVANVTELLYFGQGIIIPTLRLAEPYFFAQMWRNMRKWWNRVFTFACCRKYNSDIYNPDVVGAKYIN
jgi:hypothetical protein